MTKRAIVCLPPCRVFCMSCSRMFDSNSSAQVYLTCGTTDGRKSFQGLMDGIKARSQEYFHPAATMVAGWSADGVKGCIFTTASNYFSVGLSRVKMMR